MEIIIVDNPDLVAKRCANLFVDLITKKSNAVLGLATGGTPVSLYQELIQIHHDQSLSFQDVTTFNLDEYVGLDPSHHQSYRHYMQENLFNHIDINPGKTHVPNGMAENPLTAGDDYEKEIQKAGGIDLQILGIGENGHIGFNEPTSSLGSRTRVKTLTQKTLEANRRFFKEGEFQPHLAITMGIGTIMDAKKVILIATGKNKAEAIANMIEGPVTSLCPASALQWHQKTTVIIDQEAAEKLAHKEYYKFVMTEQDRLVETFGVS